MIFVFFLRELGKCIVAMLSVQRPQLGAEKVVRKRLKSEAEKEARKEGAWKFVFSEKWADYPSRPQGADILGGG